MAVRKQATELFLFFSAYKIAAFFFMKKRQFSFSSLTLYLYLSLSLSLCHIVTHFGHIVTLTHSFLLWQKSLFAQAEQPHEQELLPFFLFFMPFITIARKITTTIARTKYVCQFINFFSLFFKRIYFIFIFSENKIQHYC